jgi:hypothetical protein
MSCLSTALVALLAAIAGCVGGVFLAALCVDWYRISDREGLSGYFIVSIGLVGIVVGAGVGVICSRLAGAGPGPAFPRSLGLSLGVLAVLFAAVTAVCRLRADIPPTIEGKRLDLEVEVRFAPGHPRPVAEKAEDDGRSPWHVTVTAHSREARQSLGALRPDDAFQAGGRWVVPGMTALTTSARGKTVGLSLGSGTPQYFLLRLRSRPTRGDMEWSPWRTDPYSGKKTPIPPGETVEIRYRVRLHGEPSPPPGDPASPRISPP